MRVCGFKAWRPEGAVVNEVACVPYDTVDREEALALANGHPLSFLYVVRPEIALPADIDVHSDAVYARAAEALAQLRAQGALIADEDCTLYLYRQKMGDHVQKGVVACCEAEDYRRDLVLKHEKTRQDKEDDRTRHVKTLLANTGPVFLMYRDQAVIDAHVEALERTDPLYALTSGDGVEHTVWKLAAPEALAAAFEAVPCFYIADGHHRAAAAVRAAGELAMANPGHTGQEEYNRFLAVLFPASQLQILAYNRCVRDLNGLSAAGFLERVRSRFEVQPSPSPVAPDTRGQAGMYLEGQWYRLRWEVPAADNPVDRLDVSVLQSRLLSPELDIDDPRTSERIAFVGGIRGLDALRQHVDSGAFAVAFSMCPVSPDEVMAIADAGREMPPKSTWFEPKLRSGLLVHPFDA